MAELDPAAHARFAAWCRETYAQRSAAKLVRDIRTLVENDGKPPASQRVAARLRDYRWAWDVWTEWAAAHDGPALPVPRPETPPRPRGKQKRQPKRLREAVSLPAELYERLLTQLERDHGGIFSWQRCDRALHVIALTGLRVSDLLRLRRDTIARAFEREDGIFTVTVKGDKRITTSVRGGAIEAWRMLDRAPGVGTTVADWVMGVARGADPEAQGAAYERIDKRLKALGETLAPHERRHIHRLRRTVAVRLLDAGVPLELVRDVLGQEDVATTKKYTDEHRAAAAVEALGKLRKQHKETP